MRRIALLLAAALALGACSATELAGASTTGSTGASASATSIASASASASTSTSTHSSSHSSAASSASASAGSGTGTTGTGSSGGGTFSGASGTAGGAFCAVPPQPVIDNGDIGQPCAAGPQEETIQSTCADGELCVYVWGTTSICTLPCGHDPGVCPGSTQCAPFAFDQHWYCLSSCDWIHQVGCPDGQRCAASSVDPTRLGACVSPCDAPGATCGAAANGLAYEVCQQGLCRCASDAACQTAYGRISTRCDAASGRCYDPCDSNATCADNDGCCESAPDARPSACRYVGDGTLPFCAPCTSHSQCKTGYCDLGNTNQCNTADVCTDLECSLMGKTCEFVSQNCSCP